MSAKKKKRTSAAAKSKEAARKGAAQKKKPNSFFVLLHKKISPKVRRILCISVISLAVIGAALGGFFIYRANAPFSYLDAELSRFVSLSPQKFKEISLAISVDKPTKKDVQRELLKLRLEHTADGDIVDGADPLNDAILEGSRVELYYAGYTVLKSGMREYFFGGSNLTDAAKSAPALITVGSGKYIMDLEEGLIGLRPVDTAVPEIITSGSLKAGDVVCVDIAGAHPDGTGINSYAHPLVLSPALDETYGEGFYEMLLGCNLGERAFTGIKILEDTAGDAGDFVYTSVRPQYKMVGGAAKTVSVRFPVDYKEGSALNGKEAFFEVYIKGTTSYHLPEMNDAFLTDTVGIVPKKLEGYEGETLLEKYKEFIWEALLEDYEQRLLSACEQVFWEKIVTVAEVKRVPRAAENEEYDAYMASLRSTYEDYLDNMNVTERQYPFKTFTKEYFSLAEGESYKSHVRSIARQTALEKMVFFYAIEAMGVSPSEEELSAAFDESLLALAKQYCTLDESYYENEKLSPEQRDQAYTEYLAELEKTKQRLLNQAGEEYFLESAYYNYGLQKLLDMVKITYTGKGHEQA